MPKEPLHSTVASTLERYVRTGEWAPGSRLPAERELCRLLGVSRPTLRQALAELERRGLVSRHQGRGTYVTAPRVDTDPVAFFSLATAIRARGWNLTTSVLQVSQAEASRQLARDLGLLPGDLLCRLERLRLVDDEPLILETSHLPLRRFPDIDRADFAHRSLYDVLREDYGCMASEASETFEPVILTPQESRLMRVPPHSTGLLVYRTTTDPEGIPLESSEALLRGDRARLLLHRRTTWTETAELAGVSHS